MTEQQPKTKQEIERAIIEAVANKRRAILAVIQAEKEKLTLAPHASAGEAKK